MKDLRDLIRVNGDGPKVHIGRRKMICPVRNRFTNYEIGMSVLDCLDGIAPKETMDAIRLWVKKEGEAL